MELLFLSTGPLWLCLLYGVASPVALVVWAWERWTGRQFDAGDSWLSWPECQEGWDRR